MTLRALLIVGLLAGPAGAAEVASNGTGGGPWSDPATWRGNAVPGPADDVVVRKLDVVTFDRPGDDKQPTCRKLLLDPKGVLLFKTGAGKLVLNVTDGVEAFGTIKLDGTRAATDSHELRLLGDKAETRRVKLGRGGGLLLYGKAGLPDDRQNVALTAVPPADPKADLPAVVEADGAVMLDWQRAHVDGVKLAVKHLDNTGAKPNERLTVVGCRFTGLGRVDWSGCDSPVLANCSFGPAGPAAAQEHAVPVHACPLAELKGTTIRGGFGFGLRVANATDVVVTDTTVEKCGTGLVGFYSSNLMFQRATVRACTTGAYFDAGAGVVQAVMVDGAATSFHVQNSSALQLVSCTATAVAKDGVVLSQPNGVVTLLDCPFRPDQVRLPPQAPAPAGKPPLFPTVCQQYLAVAVKDAPAGSLVEVRTATAPPAAADPNVRNSPAPVVDGRTPPPRSLTPLVVKTWALDHAAKPPPPPEYVVKVLGPAPREGADRPVLKTTTFRPAPDAHPLTLEVSLK